MANWSECVTHHYWNPLAFGGLVGVNVKPCWPCMLSHWPELGHPYFVQIIFLCVSFQALSRFRVDDLEGWAQIASDSTCWTDWQRLPPPLVALQAHLIGCSCFIFNLLNNCSSAAELSGHLPQLGFISYMNYSYMKYFSLKRALQCCVFVRRDCVFNTLTVEQKFSR